MEDIQIFLFITFFLVSAFSVFKTIKSRKQKDISFWIVFMLISFWGIIQEMNLPSGFSSKNAIKQANDYLVKEVGNPRDGWKITVYL